MCRVGRVLRAVGVVVGGGDGASAVGLWRLFGCWGDSVDQLLYGAGLLLLMFRVVDRPLWAEKVVIFVAVASWSLVRGLWSI